MSYLGSLFGDRDDRATERLAMLAMLASTSQPRYPRTDRETTYEKRRRLAREDEARRSRIAKTKPERAKNRARRKARKSGR